MEETLSKLNTHTSQIIKANEFVKGLWNDWLLFPESSMYNQTYLCSLSHDLDVERFEYAIKRLVDNNYILRSSFYESNGELYQKLNNEFDDVLFKSSIHSEKEKKKVIRKAVDKPFNFIEGPLFRFYLFKHKYDNKYSFLMIIHHIVIDGICFNSLFDEIGQLYRTDTIDKEFQESANLYIDYQDWINKRVNNSSDGLSEYFSSVSKEYFTYNVGKSLLNKDSKRNDLSDFNVLDCSIPSDINEKIYRFSESYGLSVFNILKTAWSLIMCRYASQSNIALTYPVTLRPKRFASVKGYLVNMLYDFYIEKGSFIDQVNVSQENFRDAVKRMRFVPYYFVYNYLRNNLFGGCASLTPQVGFSMRKYPNNGIEYKEELDCKVLPGSGEYRILMIYTDEDNCINYKLNYDKRYFEDNQVVDLRNNFNYLINKLIDKADQETKNISVLCPEQTVITENLANSLNESNTINSPIHRVFENIVETYPDNTALVFETTRLSYRELNNYANVLANSIRALYKDKFGVYDLQDLLVGLYMERSPEMIIAILAILKSGAAYLPLDIDEPEERVKYKLTNSDCKLVLKNAKGNNDLIFDGDIKPFFLDVGNKLKKIDAEKDVINAYNNTTSDNLAYVIYTSGSTGNPKGVMVEHGGVINLICDHIDRFNLGTNSKILQYSSICFDVSVSTLFCALLSGGCAYLIPEEMRRDAIELSRYIIQEKIDFINIPPQLLSVLECDKDILRYLKTIIVGGDKCSKQIIDKWCEKINLFNAYGPTETTITASIHKYKKNDLATNIGRPIRNSETHILDANRNCVPEGVCGELYIGGIGVARGYLGNKGLSEKVFISYENRKLYKTGDICRWLPDGDIEFIGRNDNQVKIRGYRVELEEIEKTICFIEGINEAAVLCFNNNDSISFCQSNSAKYLAVYYSGNSSIDDELIRSFLRERLPEYMIPAAFSFIEEFPLTLSGKIDKKELPIIKPNYCEEDYVLPVELIERRICTLCQEILGIERVGINDNFFSLGGNSIQVLEFVTEFEKRWNINIPVVKFFQYPQLGDLANTLKDHDSYDYLINFSDEETEQGNKQTIFMIPPKRGGCEVFMDLANDLKHDFNCVGVENYNMYHREKIEDLTKLAELYIDVIGYDEKEYFLLGFSLGGQIAMEMAAILEDRGIKNINVILLDTILSNKFEYMMIRFRLWLVSIAQLINPKSFREKQNYLNSILSKIEYHMVKHRLKITNVLLFKAVKDKSALKRIIVVNSHYNLCKKILVIVSNLIASKVTGRNNNIDKYVSEISRIDILCDHINIINKRRNIVSSIKREFLK